MSQLVIFVVLFLPIAVFGQDGSSELLIEKPAVTGINARLRVRCTDDNLRLYHNATACADEREPESCKMIFTISPSNSPAARDSKCDNPLLKDLADQCRNTCAICCEDPTYACQNDDSGIVNCEQNVEKCGMPEFSTMMIKFCPATCGLCLTKRCKDQIEDCEAMKSLCTNELYGVFMEHQCAKTCGKCKSDEEEPEPTEIDEEIVDTDDDQTAVQRKTSSTGSSAISITSGKECVDLMKNCARNKKFCHHPSYREMMMKNCAKTCGFCKPAGSSKKISSATRIVPRECRDTHPFCKNWATNGYCESQEYADPENKFCFECAGRGPTYVDVTIGSFVCMHCSGLLRGLNPPHRVKSLSMSTFSSEEVDKLRSLGNAVNAGIFLGLYDGKPKFESRSEDVLRSFMIDKYERRKWFVSPSDVEQQKKLLEEHSSNRRNSLSGQSVKSLKSNQSAPPNLQPSGNNDHGTLDLLTGDLFDLSIRTDDSKTRAGTVNSNHGNAPDDWMSIFTNSAVPAVSTTQVPKQPTLFPLIPPPRAKEINIQTVGNEYSNNSAKSSAYDTWETFSNVPKSATVATIPLESKLPFEQTFPQPVPKVKPPVPTTPAISAPDGVLTNNKQSSTAWNPFLP